MNGVFQDGREAIVSAGQFVIYDTTRPYELRFDDSFSQTIFQMPRKLLQQRIGSFDALDRDHIRRRSSARTADLRFRAQYEQDDRPGRSRDRKPACSTRRSIWSRWRFADRMHARLAGPVVPPIRAALSPQESTS